MSLPWIDATPLSRTFLKPHGRIIDRVELPVVDSFVRAGTPTEASTEAFPRRVRFIRFLLTDDWLTDLNVSSGDVLFIDVSVLEDDRAVFDGELVLVRTHFGLQVGRYRAVGRCSWLELLDGTGATMISTPEMDIVGTVAYMRRDPGWGRYEDGKEGVMF